MVVIKKHRVIINKKRNTHDKTALLRKVKLDTVGILICDSLFESYITYVEFFSINNVLREYYKVKKKKKLLLTLIGIHYINISDTSRSNRMVQKQNQIVMKYFGQMKNIYKNNQTIKNCELLQNIFQAVKNIDLKWNTSHKSNSTGLLYTYNQQSKYSRIVCRTTDAHKFRTRSGFKQKGVTLKKEQSVLQKIKRSFDGKNMQTKYKVLDYRFDLYFHDYQLDKNC